MTPARKFVADMGLRTPEQIFQRLQAHRILPLFNHADPEVCVSVIDACYAAGLRIFELTNRDERARETFQFLQSQQPSRWPELSLGAGTILDADTARRYIDMGADFIIAPDLNPMVGEVCVEAGVPWIPGCFSPSEVSNAYRMGAFMVKLFPAATLGPSFITHLHGPMPFARIIVTGGITLNEAELNAWLRAGAFALGIGTALFRADLIRQKDFGTMGESMRRLVAKTGAFTAQ